MALPVVVDLTGSDEDNDQPSRTATHSNSIKSGKTSGAKQRSNNMNPGSPQAQIKRVKPLTATSPSKRPAAKERTDDHSVQPQSSQTRIADKSAKVAGQRSLAHSMVGGATSESRAAERPLSNPTKHSMRFEANPAARSDTRRTGTPPAQPRRKQSDAMPASSSAGGGSQPGKAGKKRPFDIDGSHEESAAPAKKLKTAIHDRRQLHKATTKGNYVSPSATTTMSKTSFARSIVDLRSSPERGAQNSSKTPSTNAPIARNETNSSERPPPKKMPAARDKGGLASSVPVSDFSRSGTQRHSRDRELSIPESPLDSPDRSGTSDSLIKRSVRTDPVHLAVARRSGAGVGASRQSSRKENGHFDAQESRANSTERLRSRVTSRANTPSEKSQNGSPTKHADVSVPQRENAAAHALRHTPKPQHAHRNSALMSVEGLYDVLGGGTDRTPAQAPSGLQARSESRQSPMSRLDSPVRNWKRTLEKPSSDLSPCARVTNVVETAVEELRDDHEYWNRAWLKRACLSKDSRTHGQKDSNATSVFKNMKPLEMMLAPDKKSLPESSVRIHVENMSGKSTRSVYAVPCTIYRTRDDADVPNYSHYVSIKHNFLASSERTMQHWPYFDDDFSIGDSLDSFYHVDVNNRERKLIRLAQAESIATYVEDALQQINCSWSDVLHFLLDHSPAVGADRDAQAALTRRDTFVSEDFTRDDPRWTFVLSQLPPSQPENVAKAALLCDHFQRIAKFPLWHVARRSRYTTNLLQEEPEEPDMNELTCRICMRFHCPYHGELVEHSSSDDELPKDDEEIVQTDIIHPPRINSRSRVGFPPSVDAGDPSVPTKDRRAAGAWLTASAILQNTPDSRAPFYPCHHPGESCVDAKCSCWEARIPCEKICSCPPSCQRKFQGCLCSFERTKAGGPKKGQKLICFEDARCACFQSGRECDPDLCGDCGVCDVLDPVHRHEDRILQGRCRNASIQRGVPKHTILGDSQVHGLGLYACEDIHQHEYVGEYKGEIITKAEADRRGSVYEHQKLSYLFSLNREQEIDSTYFGTKIRFINHAGEGKGNNLYPRIIMVNTVYRIALYGARNIRSGEELFFDYGPMFPDEQLGGRERKAAPHVRNSNLVREFLEVVESEDEHGNRRARKAITNKRGKSTTASQNQRLGENEDSHFQRKPRTGALKSASGTTRVRHGRRNGEGPSNGTQLNHVADDAFDAERRLFDYNIAEEDRVRHVEDATEEDDDFEPESSSERSRDGGSESDGNEDNDEDDDVGRRRHRGRPRRYQH